MFFSLSRDFDDIFFVWRCADIYDSFLNIEQPECKEGVEDKVDSNCNCCIGLRGFKSIGVVPVETGTADQDRCITNCQTSIGEGM